MSDPNANAVVPATQTSTPVPANPASNLPVKASEDFIAECEVMDLTAIRDKTFLVAVSTGDRNKPKFLSTTIHGPYSFVEMAEEVGIMWQEHQHHAKVVMIEKDRTKAVKALDENTVDYIEANYADIVTEAALEGVFDEVKEYTCQAGIVDAESSEDPRNATEAKKQIEEEDEDDV